MAGKQRGEQTFSYSIKTTFDLNAGSVQLTEWVSTPRVATAEIIRKSGWLPPRMVVRAELIGKRENLSAAITHLEIDGGGKPLLPAMLRRLASELPGLAAEVLGRVSFPMDSPTNVALDQSLIGVSARQLDNELRRAGRKPTTSKAQREDELLELWETKYQPAGTKQRQMAAEEKMEFGALRTYLSHARARRGH